MGKRVCSASNIAPVELSVLDKIYKYWVSSEKKTKLLALIREIVVAHCLFVPTVLSNMLVNQEQAPAPLQRTEPTEPIVIPELARWLEEQMKVLCLTSSE